jgi:hypothetical protein
VLRAAFAALDLAADARFGRQRSPQLILLDARLVGSCCEPRRPAQPILLPTRASGGCVRRN